MPAIDPHAAAQRLQGELHALSTRGEPRYAQAGLEQARALSALLRMAGRRALLDDLEWAQGRLEPVARLESQTALAARSATREALQAKLDRSLARCLSELESPRREGLVEALLLLPAVHSRDLSSGCGELVRRGLRALERFEAKPTALKRLHDLGRASADIVALLRWTERPRKAWLELATTVEGAANAAELERLGTAPDRVRDPEAQATDRRRRRRLKALREVEALALGHREALLEEVHPWISG